MCCRTLVKSMPRHDQGTNFCCVSLALPATCGHVVWAELLTQKDDRLAVRRQAARTKLHRARVMQGGWACRCMPQSWLHADEAADCPRHAAGGCCQALSFMHPTSRKTDHFCDSRMIDGEVLDQVVQPCWVRYAGGHAILWDWAGRGCKVPSRRTGGRGSPPEIGMQQLSQPFGDGATLRHSLLGALGGPGPTAKGAASSSVPYLTVGCSGGQPVVHRVVHREAGLDRRPAVSAAGREDPRQVCWQGGRERMTRPGHSQRPCTV